MQAALNSKNGPIWASRPTLSSTGLLSVLENRRHRKSSAAPPLFRDLTWAPHGLSLASVDARGHIVHYNFLQNRYYHVKHAGSAGVRIAWHPLKKDDVIVAFEDCTVRAS